MSRVDPITLEVIRNGLSSIADEMALIIMRSAYSPVVRDIMDYSTGVCDADGRIIAQGTVDEGRRLAGDGNDLRTSVFL